MSTPKTIPTLISRPNNPNVKNLIGTVMIFRIGLMKKLAKPSVSPASSKVSQSFEKSTPAINLSAVHSPAIPAIIFEITFTIFIVADIA